MIVAKNAAKKSLAAALSAALLLGAPAGAAAGQMAARPGVARLNYGVTRAGAPKAVPVLTLGAASQARAAASLSALAASPAAVAPLAPAAVLPAVETSAIIDVLNHLQRRGVSLPETLSTREDAAQLRAAAAELSPAAAAVLERAASRIEAASAAGWTRSPEAAKVFDGLAARAGLRDAAPEDEAASAAVAAPAAATGLRAMVARLLPWSRAAVPVPAGPAPQPDPAPANPELFAVKPEHVRFSPAPESLPASTSEVVPGDKQIVGQDAALKAMRFGLQMRGQHYNMFVSGPSGAGRETALRHLLAEIAPTLKTSNGRVAVTNFDSKDEPIFLEFAPGREVPFARAVKTWATALKTALPAALRDGELGSLRETLVRQVGEARAQMRAAFDEALAKIDLGAGFGVALVEREVEGGVVPALLLTHGGETIDPAKIDEHVAAGKFTQEDMVAADAKLQQVGGALLSQFEGIIEQGNKAAMAAEAQFAELAGQAAAKIIDKAADSIRAVILANEGASKRADEAAAPLVAEYNAKLAAIAVDGISGRIIDKADGYSVAFTLKGEVMKPEAVMALIEKGELTMEAFKAAQAQVSAQVKPLFTEFIGKVREARKAAAGSEDSEPTTEQKAALAYVEKMVEFASSHHQIFLSGSMSASDDGESKPSEGAVRELPGQKPVEAPDFFQVSVIKRKTPGEGATVIWELQPTFDSMFGEADDNTRSLILPGIGMMKGAAPGGPSFKPGSIHKADILVVDAMAALRAPGVWQGLMEMVRAGSAEIADGGLRGLVTGRSGGTYKVPNKVKIVLLGSPSLRMMLEDHDEDFASNFQAISEFQHTLKISADSVAGYVQFFANAVSTLARDLGTDVRHLSRGAMAALVEHGARIGGGNDKLTAQFGALFKSIREATFFAEQAGRAEVTREDVETAAREKWAREGVHYESMIDGYREGGSMIVETSGKKVGQINGMAVVGEKGVPMRVTLVDYAGGSGVFSIDRQASSGRTGPTFNKALGVVDGFIGNLFARNKALPVRLSLSYEQNYGGIDGDSATSTEMYVILSALSGFGIDQGFGITGSADQYGNVQAIGGANEKIEGFYEVVKSKGFTGTQGVIIPKANVSDLQLSPEVAAAHRAAEYKAKHPGAVEKIKVGGLDTLTGDAMAAWKALPGDAQDAVQAGRFFRIYAVGHVSEGLEILTGVSYVTILKKAAERIESLRAVAKK